MTKKDPYIGKLCCNMTCIDSCTDKDREWCKKTIPCDKCDLRKRCLKEFKNYELNDEIEDNLKIIRINENKLQKDIEHDIEILEGKTKMKDKKDHVYSELEYESLRDECMEMAFILNKIEAETHNCAMCKGDYEGGYSTDLYLKTICEILYSSQGNHLKYEKHKQ